MQFGVVHTDEERSAPMSKPITHAPSGVRDPLTGLLDRGSFQATLEATRDLSARHHRPFGLILFDIDRFKIVNYGYGQQYGDYVLHHIARLTQQHLRPGDQLSRWGGQEFLCLLPDTGKATTEALAERLREAIEATVTQVEGVELHVTASFATACYPQDGDSVDKLLAASGAALHHAKASGRNRVVPASRVRPELFGAGRMLDQALRENRVVPAYQPIVDLQTGEMVAEEAVARIISPSGRTIPASAFIEAASELQLTYQIDRTIILQTFSHCVASLQRQRPLAHFVNISGNLLHHPDVVTEILSEARRNCAACGDLIGPVKPLVIEVTERELLEDLNAVRNMLKPFLDFGLRLALDDFGSGYSSYRYLADLPFSFLKIDGELIRRATEPRVRTILQGIQRTASDLGILTLAELVENQEIADIVRDLGINWGQGYHFGAPQIVTPDRNRLGD
jgi:diguanylate cyclase (GGDEF)-like protein